MDTLGQRLGHRLAELRQAQGFSLDLLSARSGLSRATLSRIERGETSPTAVQLGQLCTVYGRTMSSLLAEVEPPSRLHLPAEAQPVWTDPETGFRRQAISPPAPGFRTELMTGELPPGAVVAYAEPPISGLEQHLWMLAGRLELALGAESFTLAAGDCLRFRLTGPSRFTGLGPAPTRYLIAMSQP